MILICPLSNLDNGFHMIYNIVLCENHLKNVPIVLTFISKESKIIFGQKRLMSFALDF